MAKKKGQGILITCCVLILSLIVGACASAETSGDTWVPGERTIYIQATEQDANRAADRFPEGDPHHATRQNHPEYFGPSDDFSESGGAPGYYMFMTSDNEWRIGSYMFVPGEITVYEGERITLEILGVRGTRHASVLMDPDGNAVETFTIWRGGLQIIEFVADKPGVWKVICVDHIPTMVINIHVLSR